ncbi:hypothetical protein [Streptomyces sp. PD-S100-1]|uniref:hypothetical protein n=1 Tax=Streptomyces sp. PD-S100-1 TaxID=3394351 RepID=UPI0039BC82E4
MGGDGLIPGSARLHLIDGLPLLRPDEQVFEAMIKGWRNQQLARNLSPGYVNDQERTVRAFTRHADAMPWQWTPQLNPVSLQAHLRKIGVPPQRGRTSAIRQLVLQAPAPVIAKALGYHDRTATRLVTEAGGNWSRYAPGDHRR